MAAHKNVLRHPAVSADGAPTFNLDVRTAALVVLALAATMALLHWAQAVFVPIVVGVLISYALEPLVRALTRLHVSRLLASALVVTLLTGTIGYAGYALSDDATAIVAALPDAATNLRQAVRQIQGQPIQQVQKAARELQRAADEVAPDTTPAPRGVMRVQIEEPAINVREYLTWGSASVIAFAAQAVLVVFFVFFLLMYGDLFKRKLVRLANSAREKTLTLEILDDISLQIERFLLVLLTSSVLVGAASWIAFSAIGLQQAAFWAIAAGVFNTVPYLGPLIVTGGTAVVALVQFGTLSMAGYVAGISLAITTLEGWLLIPVLASRAARTNEVAVFVSLIFWSFIWEVWGTLLAVPMLVAVKACCDRVDVLKPVAELLGK